MELNQTLGPTPKPKFNLWLITTIILAVFLVAGGVVFAWQKSVNDKIKNDLQNQINTLQNQVQQLTKIDTDQTNQTATTDWKTYKNEQYGFEIKYPETLLIDIKEDKGEKYKTREKTEEYCYNLLYEEMGTSTPTNSIDSSFYSSGGQEVARIVVTDNKNNSSLEQVIAGSDFQIRHPECDYLDEAWFEPKIHTISEVKIDGIKGLAGYSGCCGGCTKEIYSVYRNKIFNFKLLGGSPGTLCEGNYCRTCNPCCFADNNESVFNQMLSTFKFTK